MNRISQGLQSILLESLLYSLFSTSIFLITITQIARTTFTSGSGSLSASDTLTILSILLATLTSVLSWAIASAFTTLQWAAIGRPAGCKVFSILGLSPTTGFMGVVALVRSSSVEWCTKVCATIRSSISLLCVIWAAGILLFLNTDIRTTYRSISQYNVTAGVGAFDPSMVSSYIRLRQNSQPGYTLKILDYSAQALVYSLLSNPVHATVQTPIACNTSQCDAYLLSSGLYLSTPWPPTDHSTSPVVELHNLVARHLEFEKGPLIADIFGDNDCTAYGDNGTTLIAIRFCLAQDARTDGIFTAGLFVCPDGLQNGDCKQKGTLPNITTKMSVYGRTANVVAARFNFSIVSVSDVGEPTPDPDLNIEGFRQAMDFLLDFHAAGIPAPSSIAAFFWNGKEQLGNEYWAPELVSTFRSILAYPIWMFNANNFGNVNLSVHDISPDLPAEFHTTASVADPRTRIQVNQAVFIAFICCESLALVFVWFIFIWLSITRPSLHRISSYPFMDLILKTNLELKNNPFRRISQSPESALQARNGAIIKYVCSLPVITYAPDKAPSDAPSTTDLAAQTQVQQNSDCTTQIPLAVLQNSADSDSILLTPGSDADDINAETNPLVINTGISNTHNTYSVQHAITGLLTDLTKRQTI